MPKIAIISDSHDNLPNIEKFLNYCREKKIELLIHCGDITTLQTWDYIQDNFNGEIHAVGGNADQIDLARKKIIEIDKLKIGIAHNLQAAKKFIEKQNNFDFVFYGHSHKPWIEKINNTYLANPGTLAGMFYKATFAVLDTKNKKLELKILEDL